MAEEPFVITGDLDLSLADSIEQDLLAHANRTDGDAVLVDCSGMTFIDSSGLGMLISIGQETGKQLVLQDVSAKCRQVFKVTGLERSFLLS
jgi:anti-anti-sigma factor